MTITILFYLKIPNLNNIFYNSITLILTYIQKSYNNPLIYKNIFYHNTLKKKFLYNTTFNLQNFIIKYPQKQKKSNLITYNYKIKKGDKIKNIFKKYKIDVYDINKILLQYPILYYIKPQQKLHFTINKNKNLIQIIWFQSNIQSRIYTIRKRKIFEKINNVQKKQYIIIKEIIKKNFIFSAKNIGLNKRDTLMIIQSLKKHINFKKLRYGDIFSIIILKKFYKKKNIYNQPMVIHFHTKGQNFYAYRLKNYKYFTLFNKDNKNNTINNPIFLRFPVIKNSRISSNFNLHRLHPITKRITPHKGIDFAVPIGTPVFSIGDGIILTIKYNNFAGKYIVIQHNNNYITRYMHLYKILVKKGQTVKCGQKIALSGNSGRSTGPHLHFELWKNKQAVNPLTEQLPKFQQTTKHINKNIQQINNMLLKLR